jgi:hypothetical protein
MKDLSGRKATQQLAELEEVDIDPAILRLKDAEEKAIATFCEFIASFLVAMVDTDFSAAIDYGEFLELKATAKQLDMSAAFQKICSYMKQSMAAVRNEAVIDVAIENWNQLQQAIQKHENTMISTKAARLKKVMKDFHHSAPMGELGQEDADELGSDEDNAVEMIRQTKPKGENRRKKSTDGRGSEDGRKKSAVGRGSEDGRKKSAVGRGSEDGRKKSAVGRGSEDGRKKGRGDRDSKAQEREAIGAVRPYSPRKQSLGDALVGTNGSNSSSSSSSDSLSLSMSDVLAIPIRERRERETGSGDTTALKTLKSKVVV